MITSESKRPVVYLGGIFFGDTNATGIRQLINDRGRGYAPTSLSKTPSWHPADNSLHDHFQREADKVSNIVGNDNPVIISHSQGDIELTWLLQELAQRSEWTGRRVDVVRIAPPGLFIDDNNGPRRMREFLNRFTHVRTDYPLLDMDTVLPVPDSVQDKIVKVEHVPPNSILIAEDTPSTRQQRRDRARNQWIPTILDDPTQGRHLLKVIDSVDHIAQRTHALQEISSNSSEGLPPKAVEQILNLLFQRRAKDLFTITEYGYQGRHLPLELHQAWMNQYGENHTTLKQKLKHIGGLLTFYTEFLKDIYGGTDKRFLRAAEAMKNHSIDLRVRFVFMGKDPMVTNADWQRLEQVERNLREVATVEPRTAIRNSAHSSMALATEMIEAILDLYN